MLKRRNIPAHRVPRPLKERGHNVRVADGKVDPGAEVLLYPPLVKERKVVFRRVDGGFNKRDVEGGPL